MSASAPVGGAAIRREWLLEDGVTFLNHGSFGATPRRVLAAQSTWRERMERQPVRFMTALLPPALRDAAATLADFLGASGDDLVFADNATAAVNAVIASFPLRAGDEVLATGLAYPAIRNTLEHHCRRTGARLVVAPVTLPIAGAGTVVENVVSRLGARTRLVVLDHVAAFAATVLPVARIAETCRAAGAAVLVDGAHAPGMLDLDIPSLGVDWYAGNCHKWLCAPKGAGFLWARADRQVDLHPAVISNQYGTGFAAEFDWTGTRDPSAWLSVPEAIAFHRDLGDAAFRAANRRLAADAARLLVGTLGTEAAAPESMRGAMATIRLAVPDAGWDAAAALHDSLWRDHRIEVPVLAIADSLWLRISAQAYNGIGDYERLAAALGRGG